MDIRIEGTGAGGTRRTQTRERVAVHKVRLRSETKTFVDTRSVPEIIRIYGQVLARGSCGKPGGTG